MNRRQTLLAFLALINVCACGDKASTSATDHAAVVVSAASTEASYEATISDGIDFAKEGYPVFVSEVTGVSGHEPWGRWTDANAGGPVARFTFKERLPKNFTLTLVAGALGPNLGLPIKVKAGGQEQQFIIGKGSDKPSAFILKFSEVDGNTLEITPPAPCSPKSIGMNEDTRRLGISLISMKIRS